MREGEWEREWEGSEREWERKRERENNKLSSLESVEFATHQKLIKVSMNNSLKISKYVSKSYFTHVLNCTYSTFKIK